MRVLGIDPGLRLTGYACVEFIANGCGRTETPGDGVTLVEAGVVRLNGKHSVSQRLVELDADLRDVIERLRPGSVAVEKLYSHYKHPTTAAIMGHARGIVLLAIRRADLTLIELGATAVKKSLTGHGHASKGQMQRAVQAQMGLACAPEPADVADAIAIALCAARRT